MSHFFEGFLVESLESVMIDSDMGGHLATIRSTKNEINISANDQIRKNLKGIDS